MKVLFEYVDFPKAKKKKKNFKISMCWHVFG